MNTVRLSFHGPGLLWRRLRRVNLTGESMVRHAHHDRFTHCHPERVEGDHHRITHESAGELDAPIKSEHDMFYLYNCRSINMFVFAGDVRIRRPFPRKREIDSPAIL